jgi:hypothetical protein
MARVLGIRREKEMRSSTVSTHEIKRNTDCITNNVVVK